MQKKEITGNLKRLWKEAFGDSDEFVESFFNTFYSPERVLYIEENGRLLSMLYILPFIMDGRNIGYIYGVATAKEERGKGYATTLIERAISIARNSGYDALATIPASKDLRLFYEKFGFKGTLHALFKAPENFDFGTGDENNNLLAFLPLKEITLPRPDQTATLIWQNFALF